jgi:xylulokinase
MAAVIQIVVSPHGFTANDVGPIVVESDHADEYVADVIAALEGIDFSNLSNITVDGSEGGLVALSHDGTPLRPIIWASDTTSEPDAQWCLKKHDEQWWTDEVGVVPTHLHTVTKLSWLHRSETEIWQKMHVACSPADYIRWRLVNGLLGSMTTSSRDAGRTAMWSANDNRYSDAVLALIDAERNWSKCLPAVKPIGAIVGSLFGTLVNL